MSTTKLWLRTLLSCTQAYVSCKNSTQMCFFQIDSCRLVQSLTSWNVSVFYGRFRFYRGEEVIVYSHLRRPSSVICYQLCIQRVCLSTQVGDMLVQRLAPPICYLCMSFRWFMPRFPPQNRLVLRVLNPRQKHNGHTESNNKKQKLHFVSVSRKVKRCQLFSSWLKFSRKWNHKEAEWCVRDDRCERRPSEAACSRGGRWPRRIVFGEGGFFLSFVPLFIYSFLREVICYSINVFKIPDTIVSLSKISLGCQ